MRLVCSAVMVSACALASPAWAEGQHLVLTSANTQATLHARSALTDVDGQFQAVSGTLDYDLATQLCHVDLKMDVNSLQVGSAVLRTLMLSGLMLDGDDHPTMHYVGACQPRIVKGRVQTYLTGNLTMRGQTHPLRFTVTMNFKGNTLTRIVSDATFDQRQWGLSTLLHSVDPMVRTETVIDVGKTAQEDAAK